MTRTEFANLKRGQFIYTSLKEELLVVHVWGDDEISVVDEYDAEAFIMTFSGSGNDVYLQKPKKKVKKEVSGGASLSLSGQVCVYGVDVFELRDILKRTSTIPVTITYETEE